jgi:hypothetical protein
MAIYKRDTAGKIRTWDYELGDQLGYPDSYRTHAGVMGGNWAGYAKKITFQLEDGRVCGAGIKGDQDRMKKLLSVGMLPPDAQVTVRYFKRTPDGMPRFPVAIDFHNGRVD